MSQPFIDWQFDEARDHGVYKYEIYKVVDCEQRTKYAGWVAFAKGGDYWLQNDSKDSLRMALITMGQQRT